MNVLQNHLLEMIKDLKEEIDVDRVSWWGNYRTVTSAHATRHEVDSMGQIVHLCGKDAVFVCIYSWFASRFPTQDWI